VRRLAGTFESGSKLPHSKRYREIRPQQVASAMGDSIEAGGIKPDQGGSR
jgi:hypothetical protein